MLVIFISIIFFIILLFLIIWYGYRYCYKDFKNFTKIKKYWKKEDDKDNYEQLIPKKILRVIILDQDYNDNEFTNEYIPKDMEKYVEMWKKYNPEYEMYILENTDCIKFIKDNFDKNVLEAYNKLKPFAYKCDLFRYCWLYVNGGVYIDMRMVPIKKLKEIIKGDVSFICPDDFQLSKDSTPLINGFIGVVPKHPFIKKAIDNCLINIKNKVYGNTPVDVTGPLVLGKSVNEVLDRKGKFIEGVYDSNYGKYEILTYEKSGNGDIGFIKRSGDNLIQTKYTSTPYFKDGTGKGNNYWEMWDNMDVYN